MHVVQTGFRYESGGQTWLFSSEELALAKFSSVRDAEGRVGTVSYDWAVVRGPVADGGEVERAPELDSWTF